VNGAPADAPRARFLPRNGWSLIDSIVTLALVGLLVSWAVPIAGRVVADVHTAAAAREFAVLFQALRWKSVSENRNVGLFFEQSGETWQWWEVRDGNGNGLRSAEVRNGTDVKSSGPQRIETTHRGVRLGFPAGQAVPAIPPDSGVLGGGDPIRFGRSNLISFSPRGRSSSGTLFVTDGRHRLYGVRLYGASTRIRVWRWDDREKQWRR
jgi:Tfp pilus assembly protein FimT